MKKILLLIFYSIINFQVWSQASFTIAGNNCKYDLKTLTANSGSVAATGYTWTCTPLGGIFSNTSLSLTTVSFQLAGTYTIGLGMMTANGPIYVTNTITIFPSPILQLTQSSATTCITTNSNAVISYNLSKPVNLIATGASAYTIFPIQPVQGPLTNTFTVRPASTTCYTISGLGGNGCVGSAVSCVTVIPQFTIQVSPSPAILCTGDSIQLEIVSIQSLAAGPSRLFTYDWYEAADAPPPSLNFYGTPTVTAYPQNVTTYTVEVKDALACASIPVLVTVNVGLCTGFNETLVAKNKWTVFPNPVKDKLTLKANGASGIYSVMVVNTVGQLVYIENAGLNTELDLGFLEPGMYVVKLLTYEGIEIFKIVKE